MHFLSARIPYLCGIGCEWRAYIRLTSPCCDAFSFASPIFFWASRKDAITSLCAPTHYRRPNWDRILTSLGTKHPESDVGVFFCGPPPLGSTLRYEY
ncbi:hypothetical protein B0H19DRAFT_1158847 [Mycena capillaripes]|nr:hypothetical protein B0H19DRAFT_1158847 [Mycena capillaripes]